MEVRQHLRDCRLCELEHQSLHDTKRLLNSLAQKMPPQQLEAILLAQSGRATAGPVRRLIPEWLTDWSRSLTSGHSGSMSPAMVAGVAAGCAVLLNLPFGRTDQSVYPAAQFVAPGVVPATSLSTFGGMSSRPNITPALLNTGYMPNGMQSLRPATDIVLQQPVNSVSPLGPNFAVSNVNDGRTRRIGQINFIFIDEQRGTQSVFPMNVSVAPSRSINTWSGTWSGGMTTAIR